MTCDEARERLSALLDEALSAGERDALDAHLATCVDCRRELGLLKNTVALLRKVDPAHAPAGFVDRVRAAARPAPWYRRALRAEFLPWSVKLPLATAAIVVVGVIVGSLFTPPPEPEQAARVEAPSPVVAEAPQRPEELGAPARREVRPAPPPTARAQREERAARLADAETDAARRRDLAKAAPAPAPPPERKAGAETAAAPSAQAPAKESPSGEVMRSRLALRSAAPDVSGRLAVTDREAATRALAELMAKAGGAEIARRAAADAMVIELTIPRAAWAEFTRELAALGTWTPDHEPAELPAEIRVALRITG
jgi:hypothetical protein